MPYLCHREAGTLPTLNTSKQMTTYTKTLGNPRFFAPADRIKVTITKAERDAINAANAKRATPVKLGMPEQIALDELKARLAEEHA